MRETREIAMEETVPRRQVIINTPLRVLRAIGTSVLLVMLFAGSALAQQIAVTGAVTGAGGGPLAGVTVRISGTETRVLTNAGRPVHHHGPRERRADVHAHRAKAGA